MTRVRLALIFIKPLSIPKGFMPYSVKRLFKINKDVIEVFIMLELSLTQYSEVEDQICCSKSFSEACMLFRDNCVLAGASARLTASLA